MKIQDHQNDWLTVDEVARLLGVSRNDMHLIPGRCRLGQTQGYRLSAITAWSKRNLESPTSELHRLREKKVAAARKLAKRENPHTITGKIKKRFREPPSISCLKCGGDLEQEALPPILTVQHEKLDKLTTQLSRALDDEKHAGKQTEIENRLCAISDDADHLKELIGLYSQSLILRCSKCSAGYCRSNHITDESEDNGDDTDSVANVWDEEVALLDVRRNNKPLARVDDDIRAMTTSAHAVKKVAWNKLRVEYAGDIPDHDAGGDEC